LLEQGDVRRVVGIEGETMRKILSQPSIRRLCLLNCGSIWIQ
jgi:hypothetical protein